VAAVSTDREPTFLRKVDEVGCRRFAAHS